MVIYQASEIYLDPGTTLISAGYEVRKYLLLAMQLPFLVSFIMKDFERP